MKLYNLSHCSFFSKEATLSMRSFMHFSDADRRKTRGKFLEVSNEL